MQVSECCVRFDLRLLTWAVSAPGIIAIFSFGHESKDENSCQCQRNCSVSSLKLQVTPPSPQYTFSAAG